MQAKELNLSPLLDSYIARDMIRSFMAGYGAGFDAVTLHANEDNVTGKVNCSNYLHDFNEWFLKHNKKKDNAGLVHLNENILSK